jgi:type IV pilus assembly protein PilW
MAMIHAAPRGRGESGFSLPELLVAMTITVVVTGGALTVFTDATRAAEGVRLRLAVNDNVRIGLDLMTRDFIQVGQGLPNTKVVSIPSGTGATAVNRPGPPGAALTFDAAATEFPAITPGDGLGPEINGLDTDLVNALYVDSQFETLNVTLPADGTSMTVVGTPISGVADPIVEGDLILFVNGSLTAIQAVTRLNEPADQTVFFDAGDPMNLNQRNANAGSVMPLIAAGGPITASRLRMVSYYIDTTFADGLPRLVRRVNMNAGRVVALGIDNLQFTYDLVDGATNPTNQAATATPNQIRKVNIGVVARSRQRFRETQDFVRTGLSTQVSLRSLALVDRYR